MTTRSHTLVAHMMDDCSWTELPVTLAYRAAAPYEVTVTIGPSAVEWTLGRELLWAGTDKSVGEGDVRLWPGRLALAHQLFMHLCPPTGQALLKLPRAEVLAFLQATETLVATGSEATAYAMDAELQALLDGSEW